MSDGRSGDLFPSTPSASLTATAAAAAARGGAFSRTLHAGAASLASTYERVCSDHAHLLQRVESVLCTLVELMPAHVGLRSELSAQAALTALQMLGLHWRLAALRRGLARTPAPALPPALAASNPRALRPLALAAAVEHTALCAEMAARSVGRRLRARSVAALGYPAHRYAHRLRGAVVWALELARALLQLRVLALNGGRVVVVHHIAQDAALLDAPALRAARAPSARTTLAYAECVAACEAQDEPEASPDSLVLRPHPTRPVAALQDALARALAVPGLAKQTVAEVLRICRPILSLGLMARYGKKSWVPWCGSLAAEVLSLLLNESCGSALRPAERSELRRRWLLLGLFLLWPPFFDSVFRSKPCVACYNAVDKVPLVRKVQKMVCRFLQAYRSYHFNLSLL